MFTSIKNFLIAIGAKLQSAMEKHSKLTVTQKIEKAARDLQKQQGEIDTKLYDMIAAKALASKNLDRLKKSAATAVNSFSKAEKECLEEQKDYYGQEMERLQILIKSKNLEIAEYEKAERVLEVQRSEISKKVGELETLKAQEAYNAIRSQTANIKDLAEVNLDEIDSLIIASQEVIKGKVDRVEFEKEANEEFGIKEVKDYSATREELKEMVGISEEATADIE